MTEQTQSRNGDRRKSNARMALILGSVAAAFFVGFMAKMFLLGR